MKPDKYDALQWADPLSPVLNLEAACDSHERNALIILSGFASFDFAPVKGYPQHYEQRSSQAAYGRRGVEEPAHAWKLIAPGTAQQFR
jgi:hypothetical protein